MVGKTVFTALKSLLKNSKLSSAARKLDDLISDPGRQKLVAGEREEAMRILEEFEELRRLGIGDAREIPGVEWARQVMQSSTALDEADAAR